MAKRQSKGKSEDGTKRLPWERWYWTDWMADTGLQDCSIAAQGAWHKALGKMWLHDGPDYEVAHPIEVYARWWGVTPDTALMIIDEFRMHGVCNVFTESNGVVTLLSRRRKRTADNRKSSAARQKRYRERKGRPKVTAPVTRKFAPCNGETLDSRHQTPDARHQTLEAQENTDSPASAPPTRRARKPADPRIKLILAWWGEKHKAILHASYVANFSADTKGIKTALSGLDQDGDDTSLDRFKEAAGRFFDDDRQSELGGYTIRSFCSQINRFAPEFRHVQRRTTRHGDARGNARYSVSPADLAEYERLDREAKARAEGC